MRRYIGCHTDCNSRCTVNKQIRESGRKHCRLHFCLVEVRNKVNRVLIKTR